MELGQDASEGTRINIATYVFLDFESTGLLDQRARITELCLIAVNRIDMLEAGVFPRVTNKLTLCLDPRKPISGSASYITGLYNDHLEHQKPLSADTVALVNSFLNHLSHPVCLMAHNGNRFDFPLLMAELKRINQSLDSTVFCADTLEAFRSLDGLPLSYTPSSNQNTHNNRNGVSTNQNTVNSLDFPIETKTQGCTTPPLKFYSSPNPPVMKRKSTIPDVHDTSIKIQKQEISKFDVEIPIVTSQKNVEAEKVKKRLSFEEIKENDTGADGHTTDREEQSDLELAFSDSLEDSTYLIALEMVENEFVNASKEVNKCEKSIEHKHSCNYKSSDEKPNITAMEPNRAAMECNISTTRPVNIDNGQNDAINLAYSKVDTVYDIDTVTSNVGTVNDMDTVTSNVVTVNDMDTVTSNVVTVNDMDTVTSKVNTVTSKVDTINDMDTVTSKVNTVTSKVDTVNDMDTVTSNVDTVNDMNTVTSKVDTINSKVDTDDKQVTTVDTKVWTDKSKVDIVNAKVAADNIKVDKAYGTCVSAGTGYMLRRSPVNTENRKDNKMSTEKEPSTTDAHTAQTDLIKQTALVSHQNMSEISANHITITSYTDKLSLNSSQPLIKNLYSPSKTGINNDGAVFTPPSNSSPSKRKSYKLEEIYLRVFGAKPSQSHKAEDDCVALVKVAKCTTGFMEWIDQHAVLLSTVPPAY